MPDSQSLTCLIISSAAVYQFLTGKFFEDAESETTSQKPCMLEFDSRKERQQSML